MAVYYRYITHELVNSNYMLVAQISTANVTPSDEMNNATGWN